MALDYYLTIPNRHNNQLEMERLRHSLASTGLLSFHPHSNFLIGTGVTVSMFVEEVEEPSFWSPDLCIAFRVDKFAQVEGMNTLLQVVAWLLSHLDEDMKLLFDSEEVILQRIAGQVSVSQAEPVFGKLATGKWPGLSLPTTEKVAQVSPSLRPAFS
jgi:hypothetical protein